MTHGDAGIHAGGGIWATLFGLLMWDIIFMCVPDVFQTTFQTAPLDLGTEVFYPSKKDAIGARLSQCKRGKGLPCCKAAGKSTMENGAEVSIGTGMVRSSCAQACVRGGRVGVGVCSSQMAYCFMHTSMTHSAPSTAYSYVSATHV